MIAIIESHTSMEQSRKINLGGYKQVGCAPAVGMYHRSGGIIVFVRKKIEVKVVKVWENRFVAIDVNLGPRVIRDICAYYDNTNYSRVRNRTNEDSDEYVKDLTA